MEEITVEGMRVMIARLLENAKDAFDESERDRSDLFNAGRRLAYYEMLDMLKTELIVRDADLREFGLDVDVDAFI